MEIGSNLGVTIIVTAFMGLVAFAIWRSEK